MPGPSPATLAKRRGWYWDDVNSELEAYCNGTKMLGITTTTAAVGASGVAFVWPTADGSNGQQLTTNGSATLSFAAASLAEYKRDLGEPDADKVLKMVMTTPVHTFEYDRENLPASQWAPDHELVGVFAEEAQWAMHGDADFRKSFSPMNAFGHLLVALQAIGRKVEALERRR